MSRRVCVRGSFLSRHSTTRYGDMTIHISKHNIKVLALKRGTPDPDDDITMHITYGGILRIPMTIHFKMVQEGDQARLIILDEVAKGATFIITKVDGYKIWGTYTCTKPIPDEGSFQAEVRSN